MNYYDDSLKTLLMNPVAGNQRTCLRELLAKLIDNREFGTIVKFHYKKMEDQVLF